MDRRMKKFVKPVLPVDPWPSIFPHEDSVVFRRVRLLHMFAAQLAAEPGPSGKGRRALERCAHGAFMAIAVAGVSESEAVFARAVMPVARWLGKCNAEIGAMQRRGDLNDEVAAGTRGLVDEAVAALEAACTHVCGGREPDAG
jgi:hypothetical protein